jgi:hypothetical protein
MISRKHYLDTVLRELHIIRHLSTKIPADAYDFRPSQNQRSMLELLRYLSVCGSASLHVMLHDSDWKLWKPYTESAVAMTPEEFTAALDKQETAIIQMVTAIPEEDFFNREVKNPMGVVMPLGAGLISMTLSWLTAYRMQLFLYLKQCGVAEIGTSNCWGGEDRQAK